LEWGSHYQADIRLIFANSFYSEPRENQLSPKAKTGEN
jgi:hypothetical protein